MDAIQLYATLSHTRWGLVPFVTAVCFGITLARLLPIWRTNRSRGVFLALALNWSLFVLSLWLCLAALLHFGCAAIKARQTQCLSNVKKLSVAMLMYAQDHDEKFPPSAQWSVLLQPYQKEKLVCREAKTSISYGMNEALGMESIGAPEFPANVVLLFEAEVLAGGSGDLNLKRHSSGGSIGFADGHAKWVGTQTKLEWHVMPHRK